MRIHALQLFSGASVVGGIYLVLCPVLDSQSLLDLQMFPSSLVPGVDLELLYQLVASNPLAYNNLMSLSCRTGDKQAVQQATRLLFFSMAPGPSVSCSSFPMHHWLQYKSHCSAVASSIKVHVKLLPEVAAVAKAGDAAAGGALVDFWLGDLQQLLISSKLQLLSLQGVGSQLFSYSRASSSKGLQQQLCHVAPAAHAHMQLLLWSVRGVAATAQQLVGLGPGGSSWWSRGCNLLSNLVCALAGDAGAAVLQLCIWDKAERLRIITIIVLLYTIAAIAGAWYQINVVEVLAGLVAVGVGFVIFSLCVTFWEQQTRQLLIRLACLRPVACRRYIGTMLELTILQYQNIQLWQEAVLEGMQAPPAAAAGTGTGAIGADNSDVSAILDNLPNRLRQPSRSRPSPSSSETAPACGQEVALP